MVVWVSLMILVIAVVYLLRYELWLGWLWILGALLVGVNIGGILGGRCATIGFGFTLLVAGWIWFWSVLASVKAKGISHWIAHFSIPGLSGVMLVVIPILEFLRYNLRPLTLGVRLGANIGRGHILMCLVSAVCVGSVLAVIGLLVLLILELFVGFMQGLIFAGLVTIYRD